MNASKSQKKMSKHSKWIISKHENHTMKMSENEGFTIYETDALVLAFPGKNNDKSVEEHLKMKKCMKQKKRGLKKHRLLSLKKAKLQFQPEYSETNGYNNDMAHTLGDENKNIEYINAIIHEDGLRNDRIVDEDKVVDDAENENSDDSERTEQKGKGNELNDDHKRNNARIDVDGYGNSTDEQNMIDSDKLLSSDSESANGSTDSKVDDCSLVENSDTDAQYENQYEGEQNSTYVEEHGYTHHLYKIQDENKYLLHLPCFSKFYFQGKLQITLLNGEIEVFGYKMDHFSKNKTLQLYSPRRCMQIGIVSNIPRSSQNPAEIEEMLKSNAKLQESDVEKLLHCFKSNDSLILVEKLFTKCALMLDHYYDIDCFFHKEISLKGDHVENNLGCFLDRRGVFERRGFTQGEIWSNIKPENSTVICGGKGVGKSTLLKFLINSQLTNKEAVLCIDLDPGQTEFTTPGCVSAVVIKNPLLGPNFTNITTPIKMAYIGIVNVALDPIKYMKAVKYIVQSCKEDPELANLPWFVNTMGFNKGIGLDIIINIIRLLQPDGVVQIQSSDKSKNFKISLSPVLTQKYSVLSLIPAETYDLKYRLYTLDSCSRMKGVGFQSGFKPVELREFMILSYFSPVISLPYSSLNAVRPRWIHFSKISIAVNSLVQSNYILKAINGNLVGLCNIDEVDCQTTLVATTDSNDCFLKVLVQPEVAPCIGIGLVRGIDCNEEKIFIITPASNEELEEINCLYFGNVDVPPSIYLRQKYVNEPAVYTDTPGTRNVRSVKQTFRYIPDFQKNEGK